MQIPTQETFIRIERGNIPLIDSRKLKGTGISWQLDKNKSQKSSTSCGLMPVQKLGAWQQ
jgi:hypothetical protein